MYLSSLIMLIKLTNFIIRLHFRICFNVTFVNIFTLELFITLFTFYVHINILINFILFKLTNFITFHLLVVFIKNFFHEISIFNVALEGFFSRMSQGMPFKVRLICERFATNITFKGFSSS